MSITLSAVPYPLLVRPTRLPAVQALPPETAQSGSGPSVLTLPAIPLSADQNSVQNQGICAWYIDWIGWSFSASPTTPTLTIQWTDPTSNGAGTCTETYNLPVAVGFGQLGPWIRARRFGNANTSVVITLTGAAGGVYANAWTDY